MDFLTRPFFHLARMPRSGKFVYRGMVALLFLAGCKPKMKSIAPAGLAPMDAATVREWVSSYTPKGDVRYDLHWKYRNSKGAAGGRAAIRVAPPDSLRFDFRGPFGKSGSAVVIGDSGVWSKPEGDFQEILRAAPLFWASLGMPRPPHRGFSLSGVDTPEHRAWRYAGATDTFDFVEVKQKPQRLLAEMRRSGRIVGLVETRFSEKGDQVGSSQLDFPAAETRFSFTVDSLTRSEAFETAIWNHP